MRPSAMRFSKSALAMWRRTGSKEEIVTAPGVSSTISSTPAMRSKARMLRPSLPIIFPFTSSEGIITAVDIISGVEELARRWMTVATMSLARRSSVSPACVSNLRMRTARSSSASRATLLNCPHLLNLRFNTLQFAVNINLSLVQSLVFLNKVLFFSFEFLFFFSFLFLCLLQEPFGLLFRFGNATLRLRLGIEERLLDGELHRALLAQGDEPAEYVSQHHAGEPRCREEKNQFCNIHRAPLAP